jgi:hypothetical protein
MKSLWGSSEWYTGTQPNVWKPAPKFCAESHPPLPVGDHVIYGGSCTHPVVADADLYVGFDLGMRFTSRHWPWEPGEEILMSVADMRAPADPAAFHKLVEHVAAALQAGKKVHCGCIGGHGRTGTFFAALVKHVTGNADAIEYVRKHYCVKAVESADQVGFLAKHYGIAPVKGHKEAGAVRSDPGIWSGLDAKAVRPANALNLPEGPTKKKDKKKPGKGIEVSVMYHTDHNSIWGRS